MSKRRADRHSRSGFPDAETPDGCHPITLLVLRRKGQDRSASPAMLGKLARPLLFHPNAELARRRERGGCIFASWLIVDRRERRRSAEAPPASMATAVVGSGTGDTAISDVRLADEGNSAARLAPCWLYALSIRV
jgi:hypothetical protein